MDCFGEIKGRRCLKDRLCTTYLRSAKQKY